MIKHRSYNNTSYNQRKRLNRETHLSRQITPPGNAHSESELLGITGDVLRSASVDPEQ